MRFMILSSQGSTMAPDGTVTNNMQVLDMIDAPDAEDAIDMFKEDNQRMSELGFKELFCVELSERPFIAFDF